MSTATITNADVTSSYLAEVPNEDIDELVIRFAGPVDEELIAELETRSCAPRPAGALIVGALADRLLVAASISTGETLSEPTPSGAAAAAVARYKVSGMWRRRQAVRGA